MAAVVGALLAIGAVGTASTATNALGDSFASDTTHPFP